MDIMIVGIIVRQPMQRVPRESISSMVVDGFERGQSEEPHSLADIHPREFEREGRSHGIQHESLQGVVVEGAERVRDEEAVMPDVEGEIEPAVHVHGSVEEVLPRVDEEGCEEKAEPGDEYPVGEVRNQKRCLGRAAPRHASGGAKVLGEIVGELGAIDPDNG